MTFTGVLLGIYFSELYFPTSEIRPFSRFLNFLKLSWLIPLPYALLNFYSYLRFPIFTPPRDEPYRLFSHTLYFRYVTRGNNPSVIAESAALTYQILSKALPKQRWVIEIVTDEKLNIAAEYLTIITVPKGYLPPNGSKYKARALHYANQISKAGPKDWIIHLDEETQLCRETARAIANFVAEEQKRSIKDAAYKPAIGQGAIIYGARHVENWITTLADSLRVGDDFGRFRLQFEYGKAWFGMHGSFIVINSDVEKQVGLDNGVQASITEDAWFALAAQKLGYRFKFIQAQMYEKSPFNLMDFAKQRQRWFTGLWLCVAGKTLRPIDRAILGTFMLMWSFSWLCLLMVYLNFIYPTGTPVWLSLAGSISFIYYVTLYMLGFLKTFKRQKGIFNTLKWAFLLLAQILLIPLFSLMEAMGICLSIFKPDMGFYIVKKEFRSLNSPAV